MFSLLVSIAHLLASAAWFGAMFYSVTVLQPRARSFFRSDDELEEFIATIAHGARWKVLLALALIALSGLVLVLLAPRPLAWPWILLISLKSLLLAVASVVFCWASWHLWPRRIFARAEELPRIRRQFQVVALSLLSIAALAMALGVLARAW
jgi:uncharacterized membrane protein